MSAVVGTPETRSELLTAAGWRRLFRDRPMIPLLILLGLLIVASDLVRPGIVGPHWFGLILRGAVPLAILAACQSLTMLTGGIDLSVGAVASMAAFVVASLVSGPGTGVGIIVALICAALAGLVTGIGVGVFRVHPLIMTLGMSLVVLGLGNWWQIQTVQTSSGVPPLIRAIGSDALGDIVPYSLVVFIPVAVVILVGLRRTGYGRLLYAVGDNPTAARLSGARAWQVLILLYIISALLAAIAGFLYSGYTNVASVGRRGRHRRDVDHGRSRRVRRDDRRRAHPHHHRLAHRVDGLPGSRPTDPVRGDHRRRRRRLHPRHVGRLTRPATRG
jgi:ribose transport system permease protein